MSAAIIAAIIAIWIAISIPFGIVAGRAIWRFRHEAASASGTLIVTRVAEPCLEYLALATAPADDLKGWLAVDSGAPGDLAVQFPLWRHVDSPVPVISIATFGAAG